MKVSGLCLLLVAAAARAAPPHMGDLEKRQGMAVLGALGNGKDYGRKGSPGVGAAPAKQTLTYDLGVPGGKRIKIRTGPYRVPSMKRKNTFSGHYGMLESYYDFRVEKPCVDCNILRQVGGLEYENGTNANIDSGLWLHHLVNLVTGTRRWDAVGVGFGGVTGCLTHNGANAMGGPALGKGTLTAFNSDRYFVTGNERLPFQYYRSDKNGAGTAFHLDSDDKLWFLIELMNMNMQEATVYVTMTYDILDGPLPAGWSDVKAVFLDADSCKTSEVPSPKENGVYKSVFNISSTEWTPNFEGRIISSLGHLHDGGTHVEIKATNSKLLCDSTTVYSGKPEYVYKDNMKMNGEDVAKDHISTMANCGQEDIGVPRMTKDQRWTVNGFYDYNVHAGNRDRHGPTEVMAIAIVLVAVPPGPVKRLT